MKQLFTTLIISFFIGPFSTVQAHPSQNTTPPAVGDYTWLAQPLPASDLIEVELSKVVDGDTAYFINPEGSDQEIKGRFLLIDTPELRHPQTGKQPFADEAKERLAEILDEADQLYIEYDIGSRKDKYQRDLIYIWADDILVQEILVAEGLADVAYVYPPNTRYLDSLEQARNYALSEGLGIWSLPSAFETANETEQNVTKEAGQADTKINAEATVYIAPLSGSKYHLDDDCRGLRKAAHIESLTLEAAIEQGYELCGYEK